MKAKRSKKPTEKAKALAQLPKEDENEEIDVGGDEVDADLNTTGRGKRKRVPTQKALEADIDLTLKNLKDEGNQESDIESAAKIAKTDEEDDSTEVSKEVIYSDKENTTPIDSKLEVKLDVKPGDVKPDVKVKKPRANIPCPRCGKMHRNEDHLEKHIMVEHEGIKPYLCDICGYDTKLKVKMDLHMATKHNEDKVMSYVCEVCDYKCGNQLHLRAHLQIVHLEGLTPFECGVCQYQCRKSLCRQTYEDCA